MIPYVVGERNYGLCCNGGAYKYNKDSVNRGIENSIKVTSKKVKCLNDNMEFSSMSEAARYYGIQTQTVSNSVRKNRSILNKKQNKFYQFKLC